MPPAPTARPFPTAVVIALIALASAAAVAWTRGLDPASAVGMAPVAGVTLGALLLLEPRRWPVPLVTMAVVVSVVGLGFGDSIDVAVAPAVAALVATILSALALRRWAHGWFTLRRTSDVLVLSVVAVASSALGAAIGAGITGITPTHEDFWSTVAHSAIAIGLGIVVVTTAILSWSSPPVAVHRPRAREAVLLAIAVSALGILALRVSSDPRSFAVVLVLVWAAVRFRLRGASTTALALLAIADWALANDHGPLAGASTSADTRLLTLQVFAATAVVGALLLAAALDERDIADTRRYLVSDRFRRTFDAAPVGIAVTTLDGHIIDANAALCSALGYSRRELVGTELASLRSRDDPSGELARAAIMASRADGSPSEQRYMSAHGELVWTEVTDAQVRGIDGKPDSAIVIVNDVTLRKDLEEQVLHAQKMDAVGRLAGGIAHDFNNLLAVMRGHAELLDDDLAIIDEARQRIVSMRRATDRAAALTNDLLTFSRRSTDEPETIDVHEIIAAMSDMVGQLVGADVGVELELDAASAFIDADPRRIEQVLVNLVVNASDAMPTGGRITVSTVNAFTNRATPDAADLLQIEVTDTGTGITPQVQRRIFEPFFTTKPAGSGTGLGLSTAAAVVRRYGGTITVESHLGEGTTFTITLPLSERGRFAEPVVVSPPEADARPEPSTANTAPETILLVDDEPAVRSTIAEVLRSRGYRVLEAGDAGSALDVASRAPASIDLVVSDVVMPGMDGPQLADWLRVQCPDAEILFVSGHTDIEPTSPCLRGAPLLRKPLQNAAFLAEVETALVRHDARLRARSGTPRPAP